MNDKNEMEKFFPPEEKNVDNEEGVFLECFKSKDIP